MIQGLRSAIFKVNDLEEAKRWYTQLLGFGPYFDQPFYVGFNVGGFELGLDPDTGPVSTESGSDRVPQSGVVAYWGVEDAEAEYARILATGAAEQEPVHDVGGGIKVGSFKDPCGNILGIIENP